MKFDVPSLADELEHFFNKTALPLNSKALVGIYDKVCRPTTSRTKKRRFASALETGQVAGINALTSKSFLNCDHPARHLARLENFALYHPGIARAFLSARLAITEQIQVICALKKGAKSHGNFVYGFIADALYHGDIRCRDVCSNSIEALVSAYKAEFSEANLTEPLDLSNFSGSAYVNELVSLDDLIQEGLNMHHCIGGYARPVAAGFARIFHLEHRGCSSTLEIYKGEVWELRGRCNAKPNDDHLGLAMALNTFISHQNADGTGHNVNEISGLDLLEYQYPTECYR